MAASLKSTFHSVGMALLVAPCAAFAQSSPALDLVDQAQKQVVDYVGKLADMHCTEDVVQQKLRPNGKAELSERSQFDYFLLMQGDKDTFQLSESRLALSSKAGPHEPLLLTNGFATLLLVFHPYYRNGFNFVRGTAELLDGRSTIPVHFSHIAGTRSPAALALRGREYPLDLQGTAWLDAQSGQVIRIDASLSHDMSDLDLRSLQVRVDYAPIAKAKSVVLLPSIAVVDLETPRQHWRNTHVFRDYKFFSTEAEQDPNVKVHPEPVKADPSAPNANTDDDKKEKQ